MNTDTSLCRPPDEIRTLIQQLYRQYDRGPTVGDGPEDYWQGWEAHICVLMALEDPPPEPALRTILEENLVAKPSDLRAMFRLVATHAAINALRWAIGAPYDDGWGSTDADVLRNARAELPDLD